MLHTFVAFVSKVKGLKVFLMCLYLILLGFCASGQGYTLHFRYVHATQDSNIVQKLLPTATTYPDSSSVKAALKKLIRQLHEKSYWAASIDTLRFSQQKAFALVHLGQSYPTIRLSVLPSSQSWVAAAGYPSSFFRQRNLSYKDFLQLKERVLKEFENNGYPFAQVYLDSVQWQDQVPHAQLRTQQGTYIVFDSLIINGNAKINRNFLSHYLKILPQQPFSQQKIKDAEKILNTLPYCKLKQPIDVVFVRDRAFPRLQLEAVKASQFDGIVGLLPNSLRNNELVLAGQVQLKLQNLFKSGKTFGVDWQRPQPNTQLLQVQYQHPNLLRTRIDVEGKLDLQLRDTAFSNLSLGLRLAYPLNARSTFAVFTDYNSSTILDTLQYTGKTSQRNLADTQLQLYGVAYQYQTLNDFFKPQKGWWLRTEIGIGNKKIQPKWQEQDSIYQQISLQSPQVRLKADWQQFFPTGKQSTVLLRLQMGVMWNNSLFINELFQIGGLKSLRGFNENSFFSDQYAIATLEYRLYTTQNITLFAFTDGAWLSYRTTQQSLQSIVLGVGGGMSLQTQVGIFHFVYALGQSATQNMSIAQSKVHFGLTTRF
jgi:translocation and assembly module TamA